MEARDCLPHYTCDDHLHWEGVLEVPSPPTATKDRQVKFNIYQQQCVSYCLIVDPIAEEVEVYVLRDDEYELS